MLAFTKTKAVADVYQVTTTAYYLVLNERLGGKTARTRKSAEDVPLVFLTKHELEVIPDFRKPFAPPRHPQYNSKERKYNELELAIDPSELRMEFYLKIFSSCCDKEDEDAVFQMFAGSKCLSASVVSILATILARLELKFYEYFGGAIFIVLARVELNIIKCYRWLNYGGFSSSRAKLF